MHKQVLWFASSNQNKIKDIQALLPNYQLKLLSDLLGYQPPEETGETFLANAELKAKHLSEQVGTWAIGDDSGICLDGLNGFPGVYSKRWAEPETDDYRLCELLLAKLDQSPNATNRLACFHTTLVLYHSPSKQKYVFEAICEGKIGSKIVMGGAAFAYDFIFKPAPGDKYYAELDPQLKIVSSARGRAIEQLVKFLESKEL